MNGIINIYKLTGSPVNGHPLSTCLLGAQLLLLARVSVASTSSSVLERFKVVGLAVLIDFPDFGFDLDLEFVTIF